jgi:3-hydroxybutyryl-CoA dehydratase
MFQATNLLHIFLKAKYQFFGLDNVTDTDSFPENLFNASLLVDQERINMFAELSGDFNPIHIDPIVAKTSTLGGIIAHGTLALNLIWISLEKTFSVEYLKESTLDVRLKAPAYLGDKLESGGSINPGGSGYTVWVSNQNDMRLIEGFFAFSSNIH